MRSLATIRHGGHRVAQMAADAERRVVLEAHDPADLERALADARRLLGGGELEVVEAQRRAPSSSSRSRSVVRPSRSTRAAPSWTSARSRASSLSRCESRVAAGQRLARLALGRGAHERAGAVERVGGDPEPQVRPEDVRDRDHRLGDDLRERRGEHLLGRESRRGRRSRASRCRACPAGPRCRSARASVWSLRASASDLIAGLGVGGAAQRHRAGRRRARRRRPSAPASRSVSEALAGGRQRRRPSGPCRRRCRPRR